MTSRKRRLAADMSTAQNGGSDVRIFVSFGDEFHKENLQFKDWYFSEWLNLVASFLLPLTKVYVFWSYLLI